MAGKNQALFKPFLFADQDLATLVADMSPPSGALAEAAQHLRAGKPAEAEIALTATMVTRPDEITPWHRLLLAAAQAGQGKDPQVVKTLRSLADRAAESRMQLWAWTELRRRGVEPDAAEAAIVAGVIVEVDGGRGVETLAAYADGTARYLLPSGARLVWDAPDKRLAKPIADTIKGAQACLHASTPGRLAGEPGPQMARMTWLTRAGCRAAEETLADAAADFSPRAELFGAATVLLSAVIKLAGW